VRKPGEVIQRSATGIENGFDAADKTNGWIGGGAGNLGYAHRTGRAVDTNDIGEGAAGIDADPEMGASLRHVATPRMRSPSADPAGLCPAFKYGQGAAPESKTD
jgi:hypothetical protein